MRNWRRLVSLVCMSQHYGHILDLPEKDEKLLWSLVCLLVYEAIKQAQRDPDITRYEALNYLERHDLNTIRGEIQALLWEFAGALQKRCKKITKTNAEALLKEGLRIFNVNRDTQDARNLFLHAFMSFPGGKIE